jgi:hypothetical protein
VEQAEAQDQAAVDEVTKDIGADNAVMKKYTDLETTVDNDVTATEKAIETAEMANRDVEALPLRPIQEFALEKVSAGLHQQLAEMTNLMRLVSNNSWKNAAFLAKLEAAQQAAATN